MKRILIALLVIILMFSVVGCGNKETTNAGVGNSNTTTTQSSSENSTNESTSNGNNPFANIGGGEINLGGIEVYDDVPENTIQFNIESFKMDNIENFDDADMAKIDNFTESELQAIATTKANLLNKLTIAFKNAGINVAINETSGEISLDSSVLFGGDSAVLSSDGKAFLKKFISTYTSVVFSNEFDGFISKILVEGHTAPVSGSTYESGLPLSKERANKVKDYCLSSETGISKDYVSELTSTLEAVGLSNSKPVKDSNGNVDMAASRRVSFRFLINLD